MDDALKSGHSPPPRQCPEDKDQEFWTLYYNIFNIVEQWSHKKSCTMFCYQLIIKMMCCGNLPFYLHALKYQPKSKSGYFLPSFIPNARSGAALGLSAQISPHPLDTNDIASALPADPSKSPIIKFLISNLQSNDDGTKRDTLRIILEFIQELPEEFVSADRVPRGQSPLSEWYHSLLKYLEDKIIISSNPDQPQELKLIAAIFTAFAERDAYSYFVPAVRNLLVAGKQWNHRMGLEALYHAVVVFGSSLSRYNFTLGACLSPLSTTIYLLHVLVCSIILALAREDCHDVRCLKCFDVEV